MNLPIRPFTSKTTFGVPVAPVWTAHRCAYCNWMFQSTGEPFTPSYRWSYVFDTPPTDKLISHGICLNCYEKQIEDMSRQ